MGQNRPKLRVLTKTMDFKNMKSLWDPKTVSNSPRNGSELVKTVSVHDGHVNATRGSSIVEIALGPQISE